MNNAPRLMGRNVVTTDIDCPAHAAQGLTTFGGSIPKLVRIADGERRDDEPDTAFCHVHGYQEV